MKTKIFIVGTKPKGKNTDIKIIIDDQYGEVAETHCRIRLRKTDFQIEDLGSSTGTYVNGNRITKKTKINIGDNIVLGFNNKLSLEHPTIKYVYDAVKKKIAVRRGIYIAIIIALLRLIYKIATD